VKKFSDFGEIVQIVVPTQGSVPDTVMTASFANGLTPGVNAQMGILTLLSWKTSAGVEKAKTGLSYVVTGNTVVVTDVSATNFATGDVLEFFVSIEKARSVTATGSTP